MAPRLLIIALVAGACLSLSGRLLAPAEGLPSVDAGPPALAPDAVLIRAVVRHLAEHSPNLAPGEIARLAPVLVEESRRRGLDPGAAARGRS